MRLDEILTEKAVESTWITDLSYNRPNKVLTMRLSNGRTYSVPGVSRSQFEKWYSSASKGKYFHSQIKNRYSVTRIK